jgi:hypothetical protein
MTTSWSHVMRGQLPSALKANVGGTFLALVALVGAPWSVATAVRGRWIGGPPPERWVVGTGLAVIAVTIVDWVIRLTQG